MQLRTSARLLASAGALVLVTTLTSCGFDNATDRVYTPAAGVNDREGGVDVLGAVIVSAQEGSGTFIASFANNDQLEPATVDAVAGAGDDAELEVTDFEPIEIAPGALVNLATDGGIVLTGDFGPGDFVTLTVTFGDGDSVEVDIPTVTDCAEWEGLDTSAEGTDAAASGDDQCGVSGAPEAE